MCVYTHVCKCVCTVHVHVCDKLVIMAYFFAALHRKFFCAYSLELYTFLIGVKQKNILPYKMKYWRGVNFGDWGFLDEIVNTVNSGC